MGKSFIIFLLAVVSVLSCSKENGEPEGRKVRFGVVRDHIPTKLTETSFDSEDLLNVFAFLVKDGGEIQFTDPWIGEYTSDNMAPHTFTYSQVTTPGSDGLVYDTGYFWPEFYKSEYEALQFYSYYACNVSQEGKVTGPSIQYVEGDAPNFNYVSNIADQAPVEDFLVAVEKASHNDVSLVYRHPLAKVVMVVELHDWIGTETVSYIFDDLVVEDMYSMSESAWVSDSPVKADVEIVTYENEKTFYAIPQTVTEFAVAWNYHKEMIRLAEPIVLVGGQKHTITVKISADKVIDVIYDDTKWDTVVNENVL